MACRSWAGCEVNIRCASHSHCPIAVPPLGRRLATARFADSRVCGSATARLPSGGKIAVAWCVPAITANATPSRMTSTAAAVAARASAILLGGAFIEPEQSTMMISALSAPGAGAAETVPAVATVTTALTSRPPSGRYSFW